MSVVGFKAYLGAYNTTSGFPGNGSDALDFHVSVDDVNSQGFLSHYSRDNNVTVHVEHVYVSWKACQFDI